MYNVSANFHSAVLNTNNEQRALLALDGDLYFDNGDISSESGIVFNDNFCLDEDLAIGATPSNQLSVSIINDNAALQGTQFGKMRALLGVYVGDSAYTASVGAELFVDVAGVAVEGSTSVPYLSSGVPIDTQPSAPVYALFAYQNTLYTIHSDGTADKYTVAPSGITLDSTYTTNAFMAQKWAMWAEQGRCVSVYDNYIYEFVVNDTPPKVWNDLAAETWADVEAAYTWNDMGNVVAATYECAPLGTFYCERPAVTNGVTVDLVAYDKMKSLDERADAFWVGVSYPATLQNIYNQFCAYYGLTANNALPINGEREYQSAPASLSNITARDILGHIAEAAGSIARFNRDEQLVMSWFTTNSVSIPWWFAQTVNEYSVAPIDAVYIVRANGTRLSYGSGSNVYEISNNPLFEGGTSVTPPAQQLYNRLSAFAAFSPGNVSITADWSIMSGDIITVNGVSTPVYVQNIVWNGGANATIENTGSEYRAVPDSLDRELSSLGNTAFGIQEAVANNRLFFDNNGLTVKSGGIRILDGNGNIVFEATEAGDLSIVGAFESGGYRYSYNDFDPPDPDPQYWHYGIARARLTSDGLHFYVIETDSNYVPLDPDGEIDLGGLYWDILSDGISQSMSFLTDVRRLVAREATVSRYLAYSDDLEAGTGTQAVWLPDSHGYYGDFVLGISSSSLKYKKDITPLSDSAKRIIDSLRPVEYTDKNDDTGARHYGFIAEEADKVAPKLVFYQKGEPDSFAYDRVPVLLVEDNKRMHREIEDLQKQVETLKKLLEGK